MNERITKQDGIEHKPRRDTNNYVYVGGLSLFGLAISGYLLYSKFKKPEQTLIDVPTPHMLNASTEPKRDIFEILQEFLSYKYIMVENYKKDLKESVYYGAIISVLAIGYTMLGKTLIKMSPPSLSKFDIEDGVKLVAIVAMSDFTKDYLIKQKIIPDNI